MRIPRTLVVMVAWVCMGAFAGAGVAGHWQGALDVGVPLRLAFSIAEKDRKLSGTLTSLDQGGAKLDLSLVTEEAAVARFEVKTIGGIFEGTLNAAGTELTGTWSQGLAKFPLTLKRLDKPAALVRPQEPKKPYPYREEEVSFAGPAKGVQLAGTFSLPNGDGPFPAVVLITGSGPQDRDEALMGHRPFLVLADHLVRRGIAVLRCDDRGFAKSTGDFAASTTADFVEDARAALGWLRTRSEVDRRRVGLIGHSEGGIIAPIVATRDREVAFIVLMAGVGVPMKDLLARQAEDVARLGGASEASAAKTATLVRESLQALAESVDDATLEKRLRELTEAAWSKLTPEELAKAGSLERALAAMREQSRSPWLRWAIRYDPAPVLREVRCPVLAVNGDKDCQVAARENIDGISQALAAGGNRSVKTVILPRLNHLLQTCQTGAVNEYGEIEETMAPVALETISGWILSTPSR